MRGYCTMLALGNYGRFANGIFQVAGVIGVARMNGMQPVFPLWQNKDHKERFGSIEDTDVYKYFENPLPNIPAGLIFRERPVEWGYHKVLLPDSNWNISGHFQSFRYFEHCADEVKYYLKMKGEKQIDACAIHYRAGDYQHGQDSYHPRMPLEYYERALEHFPNGQKYLVFSDERDEARKLFDQLGIKYELSFGNDYIEDFRLMKGCKGFIIANSSYSAIAAWLGEHPEKKVVSPSGYNWFGDVAGINGNDIVHESWVQIRFDKSKSKVA